MALRRTQRPYRPRKPGRKRGSSGLLFGLLGVAITAAGAGLLWLAYTLSFDIEAEADRAVGVSIGNLRFAATDSVDFIGVTVIGFFGLFLVVLGVKTVISAVRGTGF